MSISQVDVNMRCPPGPSGVLVAKTDIYLRYRRSVGLWTFIWVSILGDVKIPPRSPWRMSQMVVVATNLQCGVLDRRSSGVFTSHVEIA